MTLMMAALLGLVLQVELTEDQQRFDADVNEAVLAVQSLAPQLTELSAEGQMDVLGAYLLEHAELTELRPGHLFLFGEALFRTDPAASQELHRQSFEAGVDYPFATLSWAMQLHRSGRHAEALETYALYLKHLTAVNPEASDTTVEVLSADCLLALGRHQEAVDAWNSADMATHHTRVETSMHKVHGGAHPERRRADLLAALDAGDLSKIESLIWLDLRFDFDWWNDPVQANYLARDMELCQALLIEAPERLADLELLVEEINVVDPFDDPEYLGPEAGRRRRPELRRRGYLGLNARLPSDSELASNVFESWVSYGVTSHRALLQIHEEELRARCMDDDDEAAFRILVALVAQTQREDLSDLEAFGWERYQDLASLRALVSRESPLAPDHPYLAGAREHGRGDPALLRLCADAVQDDPNTQIEFLVLAVQAHFANFWSWHEVQEPMAALDQALSAPESPAGQPEH